MKKSNGPRESYLLDDLPLPYVEADSDAEGGAAHRPDVYDDSVDVYVEQQDADKPYAQLNFVPAGPVGGFILLGFGPDELRRLGRFLIECSDDLEKRFGKP